MSFSETRTFPWRRTPDFLATFRCCIKFRTSQLFLLFFFCVLTALKGSMKNVSALRRIQSRDINRSSVSIGSFPLCSGLPGLKDRAGRILSQTISINPHQRFARHYAPARHYVNVFPLKLLVARILDSAECFLRGREDVRLRAGRLFRFFGNLIWTKLLQLCRDHLSGCNKRGAPGCQVWSWTSTFLSTWAPDAFPCPDQTTCLWAAVVWHATHMGPLSEQQLTHTVVKKKNNQSSPGVDCRPFSCPSL